ncbi:MAG: type III-B CRISPR module RAMP protein Cmr6 [Brockia lithotrophica]|nr:type III-B CRISPR module RAMP protein Cmr6 [Brockia lithotrophica]
MIELFNELRLSERQKAALRLARARRHERLVRLSATHVVRVLRGRPQWAWLHGFGGEHVRETSLTIHPVYGVPYIPGSTVKGALLHWVLEAFFEGDLRRAVQTLPGRSAGKGTGALEPDGATVVGGERLAALVLREAFGFRGDDDDFYGSAVQFWDALPDEDVRLERDVLNPHYPQYYRSAGKKSPTDDEEPVPVEFYRVVGGGDGSKPDAQGALEWILTASRARLNARFQGNPEAAEQLMSVLAHWLRTMLTEEGIGAKTAIGYGRFTDVEDVTNQVLTEAKERLEAVRAKAEEERRKRAEAEAARQRVEEEARRRAEMTEAERLVDDILRLAKHPSDVEKSKGELYRQVLKFAEEGDLGPARALRAYWERVGEWSGKAVSKKQKEKVAALRRYLER